jgi:predicted nuclease of predicted toxin-antitoxin system
VKLLLDQNLSPRLVDALHDVFEVIVHVRDVGLQTADDRVVCEYAAQNGFVVVTKDADFNARAFLLGPPPKVIWIQRGNCSTQAVADLLRSSRSDVMALEGDPDVTVLVLT